MVLISEVGPRDGLQSISSILPIEAKMKWIRLLFESGIKEIEVGSMVPPHILPQMEYTEEIVKFAIQLNGLNVAVLVPNLKGAFRAIEAGAHKISIPLSVSQTHSLKNVRKDHAQMLEEISNIARLIESIEPEKRPHFEVGLSTAFGCTIEGEIAPGLVAHLALKSIECGAKEVCLSDTTGYASPKQIKDLVVLVRAEIGNEKLNSLHLHNTRGLGLANVVAGLESGISTFDSSMGGIGGCPYAPGASGNIVTEDLVFMLESMGINTSINYDRLLRAREFLASVLPNEELYGFVPAAGLPKGFRQ